MPDPNLLHYGDNLDILRRYIPGESVDLIYLDPPFNSNANYNVLFAEQNGSRSAAQIQAFGDTWTWDEEASRAYQETVETGGKVSQALQAFYMLLGSSNMLAYLSMMAPRLVELHRVLKPTGSLYLHCDPTASHFLKLLLDSIFGVEYFGNEIIWQRTNAKGLAFIRFAKNHDVIIRYTKSDKWIWNAQYTHYDEEYIKGFYRFVEPETERRYQLADLTNPNPDRPNLTYEFLGVTRVWRWTKERMQNAYNQGIILQTKPGTVPRLKRYLDEQEGMPIGDVWTDIPPIQASSAERRGYPTQKPVALLDRIIQASSNPGDLVLDPFCGCGTTIASAQKLGRRWIGIDITHLAIGLIKRRLNDSFGDQVHYKVIGEPVSVPDAEELAGHDPYQFQWWALGLVDARPVEGKKGADQGIDGRLYFHDESKGKTKQVVISVKAGHTSVNHLRDLRGVLDREQAQIAVLITMQEPSKPMHTEAASAGFYPSQWGSHPRLQILTIAELLDGKKIDMPPIGQVNVTFKKAPRNKDKTDQPALLDDPE
jgi:site-specific DNA-methyltransferase (adenine-specific)